MIQRAVAVAIIIISAIVPGSARADATSDVAERLLRLLDQGVTIVESNRNSCDAMGDKLGKLIDDNAALIHDAKTMADRLSAEQKKALETKYKARIEAAIARMDPGMQHCATNAKVMAALRKIN